MEVGNIIALIFGILGFAISIISLVVSPIVNLRAKKLEKRLEYRFDLFQKILELWEYTHVTKSASGKDFEKIMFEINKLVQLYGYDNEIASFRILVEAYNVHGKSQDENSRKHLFACFESFFSLAFGTYRKELRLRGTLDRN